MEGSGQPSPALRHPEKPYNSSYAAVPRSHKRRNREHTNSRAGCSQCKARKVKCDEEKPRCRACARRGTSCTYSSEVNGLNRLATAASAASSPHERSDHSSSFTPIQSEFALTPATIDSHTSASFTPIQSEYGHPSIGNSQPAASFAPTQEFRTITPKSDSIRTFGPSRAIHSASATARTSPLTLNLDHLELLHHFIAVTSSAITLGSFGLEVWQVIVPKVALSHDWLMHSLLAISALHLAHLRPEQQDSYWKRAAMHQDQALRGQQKALANPNRENADALYASTITSVYLAFAFPKASTGPSGAPLHQVIQCVNMLQGLSAIFPTVKDYIEHGPLSHLKQLHPGNIKSNPTFGDPSIERHFSDLLIFSSTNVELNEDHEMNDVGMYAAAASSLRASFLKVESLPERGSPTPAIWQWAVCLSGSFVTRLGERRVVPLVLIAHWCVLLSRLPHFWWIHGWVNQTLGEIRDALPDKDHHWLGWPDERILEIRAQQVAP